MGWAGVGGQEWDGQGRDGQERWDAGEWRCTLQLASVAFCNSTHTQTQVIIRLSSRTPCDSV